MEKIACALSGGGAFAAYGIGSLIALAEGSCAATSGFALVPDILTGTSAGAFNAAWLVADRSVDFVASVNRLRALWLGSIAGFPYNGVFRIKMDPVESFLRLRNPFSVFAGLAGDALTMAMELSGRAGQLIAAPRVGFQKSLQRCFDPTLFVDGSPLSSLIQAAISTSAIPGSSRLLRVAATDAETGEMEVFENRDFRGADAWKIIAASTALPGLFRPVSWSGRTYVDGSLVDNSVVGPALAAGATTVHAIGQSPATGYLELLRDFAIGARFGKREAESTHDAVSVHRYHASAVPGSVLKSFDFSPAFLYELMNQGYRDAVNHDCSEQGCIVHEPKQPGAVVPITIPDKKKQAA